MVLDGSPAVIAAFRANHPDCKAEIVETYFAQFETDERLAPGGTMFMCSIRPKYWNDIISTIELI